MLNMNKKLLALQLISVLMVAGIITGCSAGSKSTKTTIKVGSKNFTESLILGEVYSEALEHAGYKVERKFNLGDAIVHTSLVSGQIDLYPEYTGTGLLSILTILSPFCNPILKNILS